MNRKADFQKELDDLAEARDYLIADAKRNLRGAVYPPTWVYVMSALPVLIGLFVTAKCAMLMWKSVQEGGGLAFPLIFTALVFVFMVIILPIYCFVKFNSNRFVMHTKIDLAYRAGRYLRKKADEG